MHAYALEALEEKLKSGARVLDVGSGTGYLTACFAVMVGSSGISVGVEHIKSLADKSLENIRHWNAKALDSGNIQIISMCLPPNGSNHR